MKKTKLAFSLVELAVVVLIIGLLTAGIMKGSSIIRSSRISSARSLTVKSHINEIPGMVAWYETSMIDSFDAAQVTDASQLTQWRDISPSSLAAQRNKLTRSASSAVIYKSEGINNIPSVQFSASGNLTLTSFYQGGIGQSTIFIVMRPTLAPNSTTMSFLDSHSSSATVSMLGIRDNKVMYNIGSSTNTSSTSNVPSFTINSNYMLALYLDNTNSRAFVNDAVLMAGGNALSPGTNPINGLTIGTAMGDGTPFSGLISEIIIYDRPLSSDERKSVMSYLSKKYSIRVTGI